MLLCTPKIGHFLAISYQTDSLLSIERKHILSLDDFAGLESEIGSSQPIVDRRGFGMRVLSISLDDRKIPPAHGEIRMPQDILK